VSRGEELTLRLFRFDPDTEPEPAYRDYVVSYDEHTTILDLLERVNERDPFAFHRECRMFKCGICAVNVNGRPSLACKERVYQRGERDLLVIEPLDSYPLIKDLMVDFSADLPRRGTLRAFPEAAAAGVVAAQATGRESQVLREYTACIRCGMCVEVCAKVLKNNEERVNPLHMLDLARLALDHRDQADRVLEALSEGLQGCTECLQCDQVCPVDLPVFELSIATLRDMMRERGLS
jgi:succinate dehydrogenase / fumarate reductase iron-sulfur subunit